MTGDAMGDPCTDPSADPEIEPPRGEPHRDTGADLRGGKSECVLRGRRVLAGKR